MFSNICNTLYVDNYYTNMQYKDNHGLECEKKTDSICVWSSYRNILIKHESKTVYHRYRIIAIRTVETGVFLLIGLFLL